MKILDGWIWPFKVLSKVLFWIFWAMGFQVVLVDFWLGGFLGWVLTAYVVVYVANVVRW